MHPAPKRSSTRWEDENVSILKRSEPMYINNGIAIRELKKFSNTSPEIQPAGACFLKTK